MGTSYSDKLILWTRCTGFDLGVVNVGMLHNTTNIMSKLKLFILVKYYDR